MDKDSEKLNINDLPEEVFVKILNYLSPKMIKTSALVCDRWNSIISNSLKSMNKFQLNLMESDSLIKKAKTLKRKFVNVKINRVNSDVIEILSKFDNLKYLYFNAADIKIELNDLISLLSNVGSVEILHIKYLEVRRDTKEEITKVNLLKLKELIIDCCSVEVLQCIDANSMKKFEVNVLTEKCDAVVSILEKQKDLELLSIIGMCCNKFFQCEQIYHFDFKLQSLSINGARTVEAQINENVAQFLLEHKNSLKSLELFIPVEKVISKVVLRDLSNLNYLQLDSTVFNSIDKEFCNSLSPCSNIKQLKLTGLLTSTNFDKAIKIMEKFSSLQKFDYAGLALPVCVYDKFCTFLEKKFRKLESLKIASISKEQQANIYFPKLKSFEVLATPNENFYTSFLRRHSETLETIIIQSVNEIFIKGLIVDEIMNCTNLKHLIIKGDSPLATRMFNRVSSKKNFWILESRIATSVNNYITLKFCFPDDLAVFQNRSRVYSDELIREFDTHSNIGLNDFINKYK